MAYKNPQSILVLIYVPETKEVLMLQRNDDAHFWQSVTGSLEQGESPQNAAMREVKEEIGIDIKAEKLTLIDTEKSITYEIFPQYRHRYAPNIRCGQEHWFLLPVKEKFIPTLTEHRAYQWLKAKEAAQLTKSWNNKEAILTFVKD